MIAIDSEFQSLIPPLSDDEYKQLEKSILAEGVRNPIITWNGTIIDGHNRYNVCEEHGIECPQVEREFESRDAAKIWIIGNQLGRRNLEAGQRAALVIERNEAEVRERARLRHKANGGDRKSVTYKKTIGGDLKSPADSDQAPEPEKGRTAEILAKQAGVGSMTIKRTLAVKREDPELYEQVRKGEVAVSSAYGQIKSSKPKTADDGRRICSICGEPIDDGEHYQDKLNWHRQCGLEHAMETQRKYRNPTIGDTSEVLTHDKAELRDSMLLVVQDMGDTLQATVGRYETMGVNLNKRESERILKCLKSLAGAIESIKD